MEMGHGQGSWLRTPDSWARCPLGRLSLMEMSVSRPDSRMSPGLSRLDWSSSLKKINNNHYLIMNNIIHSREYRKQ